MATTTSDLKDMDPEEWVCPHYQIKDFPTIMDLLNHRNTCRSCENPECPKAGRCGGECARNF